MARGFRLRMASHRGRRDVVDTDTIRDAVRRLFGMDARCAESGEKAEKNRVKPLRSLDLVAGRGIFES